MKRRTLFLLALTMLLCQAGCKEKEEKPKSKRPNLDTLRAAEVGSYIYFGEYEQDNRLGTGKEAIEWRVLDKREDKMLVISRYGLDCQPYNIEDTDVTWETCSLRGWLNNSFYEAAFIPEEKDRILTSEVTEDANPEHETPAGNDTMDRVFLLSVAEANRYFADDITRWCIGTPYCFEQGAYKNTLYDTCWWWLRSLGNNAFGAAYVSDHGTIGSFGSYVNNDIHAVRPAMWINLNP